VVGSKQSEQSHEIGGSINNRRCGQQQQVAPVHRSSEYVVTACVGVPEVVSLVHDYEIDSWRRSAAAQRLV
jgi:hypothetical protein